MIDITTKRPNSTPPTPSVTVYYNCIVGVMCLLLFMTTLCGNRQRTHWSWKVVERPAEW